jgi:hypothetical protein
MQKNKCVRVKVLVVPLANLITFETVILILCVSLFGMLPAANRYLQLCSTPRIFEKSKHASSSIYRQKSQHNIEIKI